MIGFIDIFNQNISLYRWYRNFKFIDSSVIADKVIIIVNNLSAVVITLCSSLRPPMSPGNGHDTLQYMFQY